MVLFSQSDIDTLRLIFWCQFVRPEYLNSLSNSIEQDGLPGLPIQKARIGSSQNLS